MKAAFNWEDPFALDQALSDDERAIAHSTRQYAHDKLQPRIIQNEHHAAASSWQSRHVPNRGRGVRKGRVMALVLASSIETGL